MTRREPIAEIRRTIEKATYRLKYLDQGWGGPYGQDRLPATWECVDCHREIPGTDLDPWATGLYRRTCSNGHSPCRACGALLPRLTCGCPREHQWNRCPGKTEDDKMLQQHADRGHNARPEVHA